MAVTKVRVLNNKQVRLTVTGMVTGATYNMTISNVKDFSGNNIAAGVNPQSFIGLGTLPKVVSMTKVDLITLDVLFDKTMDSTSLEDETNYSLAGSPARTVAVATALPDGYTARLTLNSNISYGTHAYTVTVSNVVDTDGNPIDAAHDEATANVTVGPFDDHATLGTNLVAYYKLDGNAADAYVNTLNGTYHGGTPGTAPTQKIGTALDFTGVPNISYYLPDSPGILDVATSLTISAWVYISAYAGAGSFFCIGGRRGQLIYYLVGTGADQGKLYGRVYKSGGIGTYMSTAAVGLGAWYHTAISYDGSKVWGYVNTAASSLSYTGPMVVVDATNPWRFAAARNVMALDGNTNYHSYLKGYLDEIGVWDRVLSASEISALYNAGAGLHFST